MRPCSLIKSSVPASVPGRPHHDEPGVVGKLVPQCRDVGVQHHFLPHDTTRYYVRILCVYARHAGDAERAPVRLLPGALRRRHVHRAHSSSHALLRLQPHHPVRPYLQHGATYLHSPAGVRRENLARYDILQVCRGYGDPLGDRHGYGYRVGMGIEIPSPRQP